MSHIRRERLYTYEEAWDILCALALEMQCTPPVSAVPHSSAIVGALGCRNLTDAQRHVGLEPNKCGPCARHPLPEGWTGERVVVAPLTFAGIDLDAEREASRARQKARAAMEPEHMPTEPQPMGHGRLRRRVECQDDFVPPVDLS